MADPSSAFALLAGPVQAAAEGSPDPSKLLGFFAQEMQLFFAHIQSAVTQYTATGELPHSLFSNKSVKALEKAARGGGFKRRGSGEKKPKRAPSGEPAK